MLRGGGYYPVGPIESFMLTDMIVKPAHCAGLRITDDLARLIVEDAATKERNLPLLGFVLEKLFERRIDHELSEKVYRGLGGVVGAVSEHVKTVESKIEGTVKKKAEQILPDIFQTLVRVQQEEGIPTRNRPLLIDFTGERRKVVDLLVAERLLRTEGEKEQATVSLSHERLFDAWPTLKNYVERNKKELIDRTLLESRAKRWADKGRPWFEGLGSRRECRDFGRTHVTPTSQLKEYLDASKRARLIQGVVILTFILTVSGISFWLLKTDLTLEDAILTTQAKFISIHIEPKMQPVEPGKYRQGRTHERNNPSERPVREVQMKKFSIGKYEVTFEEYKRFAIATSRLPFPSDSSWGRGRRPVIYVSWDDAKAYAKWLSQETGKRYRLPTESEWEYAARSEGQDEIWAGTSNEKELNNYAVYRADRTEPVGSKNPNSLKLHDMSGNVWEWVEDCWHVSYQDAPTDSSAWLEAKGGECARRVVRGGSWSNSPEFLRASDRSWGNADSRSGIIGFRLVHEL